jgi:hypothetical protein
MPPRTWGCSDRPSAGVGDLSVVGAIALGVGGINDPHPCNAHSIVREL